MVPVREAGNEDPLEIRHDGAESFRILRRLGRQLPGDLAWRYARENRVLFRMLEVLSNPVNQFVAVLAECRRVHVSACANGGSRLRMASPRRSGHARWRTRRSTFLSSPSRLRRGRPCRQATALTARG